jgi:hypothetical protein
MTLLPYVGSVINLGNSFSQATRPKNVGQLSDMIQLFRELDCDHSVDTWEEYYDQNQGKEKIQEASVKIWEYVQRIKNNLEELTEEDVYNWTKDLIIDKTFSGLQVQLDMLKLAAEGKPFRLANPEEESKGIDGYIGDEPVSIKPKSYKKTIASGKEHISHRIIYYTKGEKQGLKLHE